MTTHSGDAPVVIYTSTQWRSSILATVAVSRFRRNLSRSARQQGLGRPEHLQSEFQMQTGPQSEHHDTSSQGSHHEEANQVAQLERRLEISPEVKLMKQISDDVMKHMDTCAIILVLLAGITFVAILQPPGSFDDGKLQGSRLVSLFMLLSTLSFFVACTGLGAVMVGYAALFRPVFYPKLANYATVKESQLLSLPDENRPSYVTVDGVELVAELCIENVYRTRRIRFYLGVSLGLSIAAYICGALAVMTNDRQRYLLVGVMGAGGVILIFEICMTMSSPVAKRGHGAIERGFRNLTMGRDPTQPL